MRILIVIIYFFSSSFSFAQQRSSRSFQKNASSVKKYGQGQKTSSRKSLAKKRRRRPARPKKPQQSRNKPKNPVIPQNPLVAPKIPSLPQKAPVLSAERVPETDNNPRLVLSVQSEIARYYKCYTKFARMRPDPNDEVLTNIKNQKYKHKAKKIAVDGCMDLLREAELSSQGDGYQISSGSSNVKGMAILKTFNDLHTSWLGNLNNLGNADYHELAEPALRNTLALFYDDFSHKDVLDGSEYYTGIRTAGNSHNVKDGGHYNFSSYPDKFSKNSSGHIEGTLNLLFRDYSYEVGVVNNGKVPININSGYSNSKIPLAMHSNNTDPADLYKYEYSHTSDEYTFEGMEFLYQTTKSTGVGGFGNKAISLNSDKFSFSSDDAECMPKQLERGYLYGIKKQPSIDDCIMPNVNFGKGVKKEISGSTVDYDFYYHPGGGAIGGISYLLNNHEDGANGDIRIQKHSGNGSFARYLAMNIVQDFLCRELPILDGQIGVIADKINNPAHSYRADGSCMDCHNTIDHMSAAYKNITVERLTSYSKLKLIKDNESQLNLFYDPKKTGITSPAIMYNNEIDESNTWFENGDVIIYDNGEYGGWKESWYKSKPLTKLLMNDINGDRQNINIEGVPGLASALRETIDYSACYSKRYFEYLTGSTIHFFSDIDGDPGNPKLNGSMTKLDVDKFEFVRNIGSQLKSDGIDLQDAIESIISSKYFLQSIYGVENDSLEYVDAQAFSTAEAIYDSLSKCQGCHKSGLYDFLSYYKPDAESCDIKKEFLNNLRNNSEYIEPNDLCSSEIYTILRDVNRDGNCTQTKSANGFYMPTSTNNDWTEEDRDNIRDLILNEPSCEVDNNE